MVEAAIFVILPLCMAMAAFCDIISMKIPNRVSVILAVSFFIIAPFSGMDLATFGWSVVAALSVFAACFRAVCPQCDGRRRRQSILSAAALW